MSCPVGTHFGAEGAGEGVVWENISETGKCWRFKVKGLEHRSVGCKRIVIAEPLNLNGVKEFIDYAVTHNRMLQGFDLIKQENDPKPVTKKDVPSFLNWLIGDVIKEESDTLQASGLTLKTVQPYIKKKGVTWFLENL